MNDKQLKVLCRFLIWLSIALLITFVGISNIFALETKTIYSTNSSGTLSNSNKYTYGFINSGGVQTTSSASVNTTVNGRTLALIYYMYEPVVLNKTYTMEINFMSNDLISTFTSSMVEIATCNADVCNDNAIISVIKSSPSGMSNKLTIQFNPITTGSILMVNLSDKTREFYITGLYNQQTFGIKSVTLDSTNQNQDIIDNQTNNTNNIINNNNSNTQEIINNQNSNASAIQDTINDNFQNCRNSYNLFNINDISTNGILLRNDTGFTLTRTADARFSSWYILSNSLPSGQYKVISTNSGNYNDTPGIQVRYDSGSATTFGFYGNNANFTLTSAVNQIRFYLGGGTTVGNYITVTDFMIVSTSNVPSSYEAYGEQICTNKLDEQTNAINDLNDSINSTDFDVSGLDNAVGWLPAGPVDSILNLPLNLFNAYSTALGLTCSPLNIPLPYVNKNLPIPCLRSIFQEIGIYNWWEGFGYLAAAIILYNYLLNLYTWVDKTLTLRESTMPGYYDDNFGGGA